MILVIVDMQPDFEASCNPKTIAACIREIQRAVANGTPIVFVELRPPGSLHDYRPTHPILVETYEQLTGSKGHFVSKIYEDGSEPVLDFCLTQGWKISHFRVCGVNTNACVEQTVKGFVGKKYPVEVIFDACNQPDDPPDWQDPFHWIDHPLITLKEINETRDGSD